MPSFSIPQPLAGPELQTDAPTWAPIVFAAGAFAVVAVVLVVMWKKLKQSEQWRDNEDHIDDQDQH